MKKVIFQFRLGRIFLGLIPITIVLIAMNVSAQFQFNGNSELNFIGLIESSSDQGLNEASEKEGRKQDLVLSTDCSVVENESFAGNEEAMIIEKWMLKDNFGQSVINLENIEEVEEGEMIIGSWMLEDFSIANKSTFSEDIEELKIEDWMIDESYWISVK